jgi:uncharacterized protein YbjT (DUF2867 family)
MATDSKKKLIVVAGGTGGIGRHIVDGIAATKQHTIKVFTRQDSFSSSNLTAEGVQLVKVDYSNHASLVQALQGVHTVIVCLSAKDDSSIQSELNLLNASLEAKVKRFAPSEYSGNNGGNTIIQLYRELKTPVLEKVKSSGIEYTVFINGLFMDYFASPQKASPYLNSIIVGIDFNKCEANIVGTGDEPFCVTRAEDVGKFVAAALDLDKWDERSGIVGSRTTWNELIKLGEQVRGKKFNVKRSTIYQTLSECDPKPANRIVNFMREAFVAMCQGEFDIEATLNQKFPNIVPTTVEEFLTIWWAGKEGQTF